MSILIQGVEVFVKDIGAGEPVFFLHGNPDSADIWDDVITNLQHKYRCIAIDLPGFGRSKAPLDFDYSFENLGRFLNSVVAAMGIDKKINLVAHDFGGAFAMSWAIQQPQQVCRIVVINHPFFIADYQWHAWARIWRTPHIGELSLLLMNWPIFWVSLQIGSRKLTTEKIRNAYSYITPEVKQATLSLYRAANPQDFENWEPRMLETTSKISTMVLWGQHDPYIPTWVADKFGANEVIRFGESGHWVPAEIPDRVSSELLRFFTS